MEFNDDWTWGELIGSIRLYSLDRCETSITKQDWLEAKTNKDNLKMNRDLMIKAAVQLKGVLPDKNDHDEYLAVCIKDVYTCKKGCISVVSKNCLKCHWQIFGTREQFEDFVESLFEGAPDDATHRGKDGLFYKIGENSTQYWNFSDKWAQDVNGRDWLSKNLIPRPAKKVPIIGDTPEQLKEGVKPQAPYMPKIGEECEVSFDDGAQWYKFVKTDKRNLILDESWSEMLEGLCLKFRPLRTERELFIEQATKDYLDQVGSDAVNAKWFERIFGALYDAGNLLYKNNTKKEEN